MNLAVVFGNSYYQQGPAVSSSRLNFKTIMKFTVFQANLAFIALAISHCLADSSTSAFPPAKRANPIVANGDFEHGRLQPAWTRDITGNASIVKAKQPGDRSNHVARITLNCNPCFCEDDDCCDASLTGTILNTVAGANYTISWNFMYALNVPDVYWLGDAYRCDAGNCFVSAFSNVMYPKGATKRTWYTYSATFVAPSNADEGPLSLDVFPGGCETGHTYIDNFLVLGPL